MDREYIVIYGPPKSGKTLNAEALREHYQCTEVIDDPVVPRGFFQAPTGRVLVLAADAEIRDPLDKRKKIRGTFIPIREAAEAIADKWVTPK